MKTNRRLFIGGSLDHKVIPVLDYLDHYRTVEGERYFPMRFMGAKSFYIVWALEGLNGDDVMVKFFTSYANEILEPSDSSPDSNPST